MVALAHAVSDAESRDWLIQQIAERESAGRDTKPWLALARDPRMVEVWKIIAHWPQETAARPVIGFAAALAEEGIPEVLAEPPAHRERISGMHCCALIGDAARALIVELRCAQDTAARLFETPIELLLLQLEGLANRALLEAEKIKAFAGRLSPGVAVHASYDRGPLAYRASMATLIAGLRTEGVPVILSDQHRLVATLTNVVFDNPRNAEVTAETEARRWQRRHPTG
jgi:hypothetical protein